MSVTFARSLLLIHRYLGIGLGVVMAMWCLSGIVMMYVPYPRLDHDERLAALVPLDWSRCCTISKNRSSADDIAIEHFEVEMVGYRPVLRVTLPNLTSTIFDLESGATIPAISKQEALNVAKQYADSHGLTTERYSYRLIDYDQWTVGGLVSERPLHRISLATRGTTVYVSSRSGKLAQVTTTAQRFWNWLGAVPHWLYPSVLRSHPQVWSQVVIWTSLSGTVLTVTRLYIGIRQSRWTLAHRSVLSPYRGVMFWHHLAGLIFGVFALTWVGSGVLSMNPWGLLEVQRLKEDRTNLQGLPPTFAQVRRLFELLPRTITEKLVSLESASLDGKLFAIGITADGSRIRFDASGAARPLSSEEVSAAALRVAGPQASVAIIAKDDNYHYSVMSEKVKFPVIRISNGGNSPTYYYLDAISAVLLDKADAGGRGYRWWHSGLHRWDFSPVLRTSMVRNLLMLPLLVGAASVCATGAYLGVRRLTRPVSRAP